MTKKRSKRKKKVRKSSELRQLEAQLARRRMTMNVKSGTWNALNTLANKVGQACNPSKLKGKTEKVGVGVGQIKNSFLAGYRGDQQEQVKTDSNNTK